MQFSLNLSDDEFNRVLEDIDQKMVAQGIRIQAREMVGWTLFCERQNLEGIDMQDPISQKVMEWFRARYGDRLNLNLSFGCSVVLVRGDVFRFRSPMFFGQYHLICEPWLIGQKINPDPTHPGVRNALDELEGMTPAYAGSLTQQELKDIHIAVASAEVNLARVGDAGDQPFIPESRADIRESVEHMMRFDPQFGASKWASLQAVEKFLKAYILQQGTQPKQIHDLSKLATTAESLGLPTIDRATIGSVQCAASVRYESSSVTKGEAAKAHQSAIRLCADIGMELSGKSEYMTVVRSQGFLTFAGIPQKIRGILIDRGIPAPQN
jgi:hypothetical protein